MEADIEVRRLGATLGAEVENLDIRHADTQAFARLRAAVRDHLVVRVRGLDFDDDDHIRLSERFGPLVDQPLHRKTGLPFFPDKPTLGMISNIRENGEYVGALGDAEVTWHTDLAFTPSPPSLTLLHGIEIPPDGGRTWFADMYTAYETLPPPERRAVSGKRIKIGSLRDTAGAFRYGRSAAELTSVVDCPGPVHELVAVHPESGRTYLYLGQRLDAYIVGLPVDESEDLLDRLWAHATQDAHTWGQEWQVGDLIIWDNRCTLHRRDPFDPSQRRRLHRTVVAGTPN